MEPGFIRWSLWFDFGSANSWTITISSYSSSKCGQGFSQCKPRCTPFLFKGTFFLTEVFHRLETLHSCNVALLGAILSLTRCYALSQQLKENYLLRQKNWDFFCDALKWELQLVCQSKGDTCIQGFSLVISRHFKNEVRLTKCLSSWFPSLWGTDLIIEYFKYDCLIFFFFHGWIQPLIPDCQFNWRDESESSAAVSEQLKAFCHPLAAIKHPMLKTPEVLL